MSWQERAELAEAELAKLEKVVDILLSAPALKGNQVARMVAKWKREASESVRVRSWREVALRYREDAIRLRSELDRLKV